MEKRCNNLWIVNKFAQVSKRLQIVIAWKFNDGWKMFFPKKDAYAVFEKWVRYGYQMI